MSTPIWESGIVNGCLELSKADKSEKENEMREKERTVNIKVFRKSKNFVKVSKGQQLHTFTCDVVVSSLWTVMQPETARVFSDSKNCAFCPLIFHSDPKICQNCLLLSIYKYPHDSHLENSREKYFETSSQMVVFVFSLSVFFQCCLSRFSFFIYH